MCIFAYAFGRSFRVQLSRLYAANQVCHITLHYATLKHVCVPTSAGSHSVRFFRALKSALDLFKRQAIRLNTGMTCAKKFKAKSRYTLAAYDDVTELQQRRHIPLADPSLKFRWNFVKYGIYVSTFLILHIVIYIFLKIISILFLSSLLSW